MVPFAAYPRAERGSVTTRPGRSSAVSHGDIAGTARGGTHTGDVVAARSDSARLESGARVSWSPAVVADDWKDEAGPAGRTAVHAARGIAGQVASRNNAAANSTT